MQGTTKSLANASIARSAAALAVALLLAVGVMAPSAAHEERESEFPDGTGEVPTYRTAEEAAEVIVVCKPDSAQRIAQIDDAQLKARNLQLLADCEFEHIQAAVDHVHEQGTNIYVLPGTYREGPSWAPPCTEEYDGGVVDYDLIVSCGEVINLVTIAGDDPDDADHVCDGPLCDLQLEGTGADPEDVELVGGFTEDGDWIKHNGLKADRANGFYVKNMTFELFRENALYVHETDGYVIDDVVARNNDLYGILTFTSDHGLIKDCETYYNGDSGVYPGSPADVNADNNSTGPLDRWAVEVTGCDTHHNALGFSGTAGNSVYFHDNDVHHNGAGYVTDSFVGGHPGMPQDHAWLTGNRIWANNENYYPNLAEGGPCQEELPANRGHQDGVVCPAFPAPVGTGILIAGGNHNLVEDNEIYDNWRAGAMLFWVPAAVRGDSDLLKQFDTSNHNEFRNNHVGVTAGGQVAPNGMDFWWDDAGLGNCWQGNIPAPGEKVTHNSIQILLFGLFKVLGLPNCGLGSLLPTGTLVRTIGLLPCAEFNRHSNPEPAGCDWMTTPPPPGEEAGQQAATLAPVDGNLGAALVAGFGVLLLGAGLWRRRRATA